MNPKPYACCSWNGAMLAATAQHGKNLSPRRTRAKGYLRIPRLRCQQRCPLGQARWQGEGALRFRPAPATACVPIPPGATGRLRSDADGRRDHQPECALSAIRSRTHRRRRTSRQYQAAYLPQNNPPVVRSITVLTAATAAPAADTPRGHHRKRASTPYSITVTDTGDAAPVCSTGTPTQTLSRAVIQQMLISWQADDPDSDKLVYEVDFRGEGEAQWKFSLKKDLHETTILIDGDALADGRYFFKVTASDREANPPAIREGSRSRQFTGPHRQHAARHPIRSPAHRQPPRYRLRSAGRRIGSAPRRIVHRRRPGHPSRLSTAFSIRASEQFRCISTPCPQATSPRHPRCR